MLPALLISFREVIEAALIVATILGILTKLNQKKAVKTVWMSTAAAAFASLFLLFSASIFGIKIQTIYSGKTEEAIEGILMITSAVFITWAVFFLHKYLERYKTRLLIKINEIVEKEEQKGLFALVFTAVFREGFEIVLFLSTIYLSSNPQSIFSGFLLGSALALIVSFGLFTVSLKLPVFYAFRITSILLILFAAGLISRGVHEFVKVGILPETGKISLFFIPAKETFWAEIIKTILGISQNMDFVQLSLYGVYLLFMSWWVFGRKSASTLL